MLAAPQGFALAAATIVGHGRGAGCDEELRQAACCVLAPVASIVTFIPWVIRPLQVVH